MLKNRKGMKKYVFIAKKNDDKIILNEPSLKLNDLIISQLDKFEDKFKLSSQERNDILMSIQKANSLNIHIIYKKLFKLRYNNIYNFR
jgi:hypothetical protein